MPIYYEVINRGADTSVVRCGYCDFLTNIGQEFPGVRRWHRNECKYKRRDGKDVVLISRSNSLMITRHVTSVETFTGRFLDYLDPKPSDISLDDIACGLSLTHRFGAQINSGYTVAEHAVFVRDTVVKAGYPELGLAALHHDSHEAYLGDWPSPLKVVVEARAPGLFDSLANAIDEAVGEKFGFYAPNMHADVVKEADEYALRREAATLKYSHGCGDHWQYDQALEPLAGIGWSESRAAREFLRAHEEEMDRQNDLLSRR